MHVFVVNVFYNDGASANSFTCSATSADELIGRMYGFYPGSVEIETTHGNRYIVELENVRFIEVYQNDPQG